MNRARGSPERRAALLLFVLAFTVYLPALFCGFVDLDDREYLHQNPLVTDPGLATLTTPGPKNHADYLPATMAFYALEWAVAGPRPLIFHLGNVLLHAAATALLFLCLRRLTGVSFCAAAMTAALFAVHPMNTEAVTWVSETKSCLAMVLVLLAFHAHVTKVERGGAGPSWSSVLLFALALLAKTAVLPFPVAFAAAAWLQTRRGLAGELLRVWPQLLLAAGALALRMVLQEDTPQNVMVLSHFHGAPERVLTVFHVFAATLRTFFFPDDLNVLHPLHVARSLFEPGVIAGILLMAGILGGGVALMRRRPVAALGLLGYVVLGLPTLQIVPLPPVFRADRYVYFSGIGLCLALSVLLDRGRLRLLLPLAAGALAVVTFGRHEAWRDSESLWRSSIAKAPDNDMSRRGLGKALVDAGRFEEAIGQFREAVRIVPGSWINLEVLAETLARRGQLAEAEELFRKALVSYPGSATILTGIGFCRVGQKDFAGALEWYEKAIAAEPSYAPPYDQAAVCLFRLARVDEAREHARKALALGYPVAEKNLTALGLK